MSTSLDAALFMPDPVGVVPLRDPSRARLTFVVAAMPRSGSTYLCDLLRLNGIGHPKEDLKSTSPYQPFSRAIATSQSTESFVERLLASSPGPIFGTKLMWPWLEVLVANSEQPTLDPGELLERLFPGGKYLFIWRRDKVAQAISLLRAIHTNEWTSVQGDKSEGFCGWPREIGHGQIHQTIVSLVTSEHRWRVLFASRKWPVLEVPYESLVSDPQLWLERVGRYLVGDGFRVKTVSSANQVQRDSQSRRLCQEYLGTELTMP